MVPSAELGADAWGEVRIHVHAMDGGGVCEPERSAVREAADALDAG